MLATQRPRLQCRHCDHQVSPTAGTPLAHCRLPLADLWTIIAYAAENPHLRVVDLEAEGLLPGRRLAHATASRLHGVLQAAIRGTLVPLNGRLKADVVYRSNDGQRVVLMAWLSDPAATAPFPVRLITLKGGLTPSRVAAQLRLVAEPPWADSAAGTDRFQFLLAQPGDPRAWESAPVPEPRVRGMAAHFRTWLGRRRLSARLDLAPCAFFFETDRDTRRAALLTALLTPHKAPT